MGTRSDAIGRWPAALGRLSLLLPSKRLKVGQQLLFGTPAGPVRGVVKYVGPLTEDTSGEIWAGVELAAAVGRHSGRGYFECRKAHGLFMRASSAAGSNVAGDAAAAADTASPPPAHPEPFTLIVYDETTGTFVNTSPDRSALHQVEPVSVSRHWAQTYLQALERAGRFDCVVWPYHCLVGSLGCTVVPHMLAAFDEWSERSGKSVRYVTKGRNIKTEMYSVFAAEVVDPEDPDTAMNQPLVEDLRLHAGAIVFAGEAKSHCVNYSVTDCLAAFQSHATLESQGAHHRVVVLEDCCTAVAGCEAEAAAFLQRVRDCGATVASSRDFVPPADSCVFLIDPQHDFVFGSLRIDGAEGDIDRASAWIRAHADALEQVYCSLDFHEKDHIAHPMAWQIIPPQPD